MYDLLLKGGRIYDGSGMPSYHGDVGIKNGKIVEIGRLKESATRTLNVDGLAVAPGFIDPHTHLDAQLFWDPLGTSSCDLGGAWQLWFEPGAGESGKPRRCDQELRAR
jgi:N-acyl-D-amino-acid deacylase